MRSDEPLTSRTIPRSPRLKPLRSSLRPRLNTPSIYEAKKKGAQPWKHRASRAHGVKLESVQRERTERAYMPRGWAMGRERKPRAPPTLRYAHLQVPAVVIEVACVSLHVDSCLHLGLESDLGEEGGGRTRNRGGRGGQGRVGAGRVRLGLG